MQYIAMNVVKHNLKFESLKVRCKLFLRDNIIKTEHKEC